jgi:hypothetical protein
MKKLLLIVAALAFSATATAQMYKWTDKDGKVRYGDTPPPGVQAAPVRPATAPGSAADPGQPAADAKKDASAKDKPLSPEAAFRKRQQERQEQEQKSSKAGAEAEQKKANCQQAQNQLRMLQSGQRMATTNAAGERVFMDDEQRARDMDRAQRAVAQWCN